MSLGENSPRSLGVVATGANGRDIIVLVMSIWPFGLVLVLFTVNIYWNEQHERRTFCLRCNNEKINFVSLFNGEQMATEDTTDRSIIE